MTDQERLIPWTQPGWFERASVWIHAELEHQGIIASGPIEQPHSRPWSTVLRVPTIESDIYFKAVSPSNPYEPELLGALGRWRPDRVPRLLSVDAERGWVLMRDAGQRLREIIRPTRDMSPWLSVLLLYAERRVRRRSWATPAALGNSVRSARRSGEEKHGRKRQPGNSPFADASPLTLHLPSDARAHRTHPRDRRRPGGVTR